MRRVIKVLAFLMVCALIIAGAFKIIQSYKKIAYLESENAELRQQLEEKREKAGAEREYLEEAQRNFGILQSELMQLIMNPKYEPEEILPLFYYICGNTNAIKTIYDNGNEKLAEEIIYTHMNWSGQYRVIDDFIKTWAKTTSESEDTKWNNMIYDECTKAFEIYKHSLEDLQIAEEYLPESYWDKVRNIHENNPDSLWN